MLEGLREVVLSIRGRPLHDIYVNLTRRAPPPWADKPEEAGIGRRRRAPLRSEAVGRLQNAAGGVGGDMYKAAANMQRRCAENVKNPRGGGRCLRNNVSDADAAPLEGGLWPHNWIKGVKCALLYVGGTTKYLKRGVNPLMPSKLKGMTSLEIAIIVAIVLIIAVAVGWYLYTTFIASTIGQPRLNVVSAEFSNTTKRLTLVLVNPGPVDVQISNIELAGTLVANATRIEVGRQVTVTVNIGISAAPGTMLPGRVILSGGQSFPFSAVVKP